MFTLLLSCSSFVMPYLSTHRYEFIHGPLCGPAVIPPSTEGELHFPHYEALGFAEPPRSLVCLWEIRVNRDRDIWLHFDKLRFATRDCRDGRLEVLSPSLLLYMLVQTILYLNSYCDLPWWLLR